MTANPEALTILRALKRAARRHDQLHQEQDQRMRDAWQAGASVQQIADALGLSKSGAAHHLYRVLNKDPNKPLA